MTYEFKVQNMDGEARQLYLFNERSNERYFIRYKSGREADVIDALADMVRNPELDFDWFDAAALSYQMGRRLEQGLEDMYFRQNAR